ncbi:nitronate monooxygenase [Flavobacteriaceae bacterium]|nr:nitronate monooxygenase [Flavobacteriaceae bacterium]MDB3862790.1 nitronate monooxygenase [Flavobacteriaceae bacterium]MDC3354945.1 nitronate monooxygenase [Flavobacteriaceae bacterium]
MANAVTQLFGIRYPIVQAGMVWASGWRLASAVSNAGGLGLLGAGSMYPEVLRDHIQKCKKATDKPFGVNVPLLYPDIDQLMQIIVEEKVAIVFTAAGNPKLWTEHLKSHGCIVVHVVSSVKFALKAQECGVDAIVAEGFEAGGHNGREETTTMTLIPLVKKAIDLPLIAAGGIGSGPAMLAAMALGAEGVQVGSRFVATPEASSHDHFKAEVLKAEQGSTKLTLKELTPVRLLKNPFYDQIKQLYIEGASPEKLKEALGRGRAKKGMFEGDLVEGELEIGQVAAQIDTIISAEEVVQEFIATYNTTLSKIKPLG